MTATDRRPAAEGYRTRTIITARIGDTVRVEVFDPETSRTLPNYGNVRPWHDEDGTPGAYWSIASGQHGTTKSERQAVHAAARAIRAHAKRTAREEAAQVDARVAVQIANAEAAREALTAAMGAATPTGHTSEHGTFTILSAAHHRNGIGGTPFYVGLVFYTGGDMSGQRMQIVAVPETHTSGDHEGEPNPEVWWPSVFVTDLDIAADDNSVAFGHNSWRGDTFGVEARAIYDAVQATYA